MTIYVHWCAHESDWNQQWKHHFPSRSQPGSKTTPIPIIDLHRSEKWWTTEFGSGPNPQHWGTQITCVPQHRNKKTACGPYPQLSSPYKFLVLQLKRSHVTLSHISPSQHLGSFFLITLSCPKSFGLGSAI